MFLLFPSDVKMIFSLEVLSTIFYIFQLKFLLPSPSGVWSPMQQPPKESATFPCQDIGSTEMKIYYVLILAHLCIQSEIWAHSSTMPKEFLFINLLSASLQMKSQETFWKTQEIVVLSKKEVLELTWSAWENGSLPPLARLNASLMRLARSETDKMAWSSSRSRPSLCQSSVG